MQEKKPPAREQVTTATSIRLKEERISYIREKASEIGISQNAFMMVLIDLGVKVYESNIAFTPLSE